MGSVSFQLLRLLTTREDMKLTVGLLALLAFGYLSSTVLAGPLTGQEITGAGMEPDVDETDLELYMKPEVQVINREETEIADRKCKADRSACSEDYECCSKECSFWGRMFVRSEF